MSELFISVLFWFHPLAKSQARSSESLWAFLSEGCSLMRYLVNLLISFDALIVSAILPNSDSRECPTGWLYGLSRRLLEPDASPSYSSTAQLPECRGSLPWFITDTVAMYKWPLTPRKLRGTERKEGEGETHHTTYKASRCNLHFLHSNSRLKIIIKKDYTRLTC